MLQRFNWPYVFIFILFFGIFFIFPSSVRLPISSLAQATEQVIQVKVENGLLSVNLQNAPLQKVLREIAHQAKMEFEGLEK